MKKKLEKQMNKELLENELNRSLAIHLIPCPGTQGINGRISHCQIYSVYNSPYAKNELFNMSKLFCHVYGYHFSEKNNWIITTNPVYNFFECIKEIFKEINPDLVIIEH